MTKLYFPEEVSTLPCLNPAADAAGRTGLYVSLAYAQRAFIIAEITQGNAATVLLTVLQATDVEGAGSKVLANNVPIWSNLDEATVAYPTRRTDAKNYTTDAGTTNKVVIFQIDPELLDVANGFVAIGLSTGASNAANITAARVLVEQRYAQPTPPTESDLD